MHRSGFKLLPGLKYFPGPYRLHSDIVLIYSIHLVSIIMFEHREILKALVRIIPKMYLCFLALLPTMYDPDHVVCTDTTLWGSGLLGRQGYKCGVLEQRYNTFADMDTLSTLARPYIPTL